MKVVVFAGGLGTRISEESHLKPKPMVDIGGKPILWHIMKIYEHYGYNDFIICLGYKGYIIKEYFMHYFMHNSDVTIELKNNKIDVHSTHTESFKVTLVDTGLNTKTSGRLKRVQSYIGDEEFMLTYGDGVADINLDELLAFHRSHKKFATMTTIQPGGRFGGVELAADGVVERFREKPKDDNQWINAGFFVLRPQVFDYLSGDADKIMWEENPLSDLTHDGQLMAYRHNGFWGCMDAMRDKIELEQLWDTNKAKWKVWK
jgi:glucose-1-phosphate cytidylyltransferase